MADLRRLTDFLIDADPIAAQDTIALINEAVAVLERHPLLGRPAEQGLRELVVSRGRTGYIALYRFDPEADVVRLLAIRHQREAGYFGGAAS